METFKWWTNSKDCNTSKLAPKPSILILDESTSGVDNTETSFFENIFKLENLTVIAISHSSNVERLFSKKITF